MTAALSGAGGPTASDVVRADLEQILGAAEAEFAEIAGRRLLITGGAGFLGFYLVQAALAWNERRPTSDRIAVTVLDNYVRGVPEWLEQRGHTDGLRVLQHDIRQPLADDLGDFEYIVHAAGIASPIYYRQHPIETMDANVTGLRQLLDRVVESRTKGHEALGFLFFSSSEIYGDPAPDAIPTPETYRGNVSCTGPRACYDESKRYGETLCVNFAQQHGVPVAMARPFNNYGPGLKLTDRRVIPDLARDVLEGRDVILLSDGTATPHLLLRGRRRRRLLQGSRQRQARRAVQHRDRGARGLDGPTRRDSCLAGERARRLPRQRRVRIQHRLGVPRRQPVASLSQDRQVPPGPRLRAGSRARRRTRAGAPLVPGESGRRGRLMRISIVGAGYVGLVTGGVPRRGGHRRRLCRRRPVVVSSRSDPGSRRSTSPGSSNSSSATLGGGCGPRSTCATPCSTRI